MRKTLLFIGLLLITNYIYSQAEKYGIYVSSGDRFSYGYLSEDAKGTKEITKIPERDTLIVIDLIRPSSTYGYAYIETVVDGKLGFCSLNMMANSSKYKELQKYFKANKINREERIKLAYQYDVVKRNFAINNDVSPELISFLNNYENAKIYDISGSEIGEYFYKDVVVLYSCFFDKKKDGNSVTGYAKAIWNSQDVVMHFPSSGNRKFKEVLYIGENIRREKALELYQAELNKVKKIELEKELEKKKEEEEQKNLIELVEKHSFKLVKSEQRIGERTNQVLPKINPQPMGTLTVAKGWTLCENGQWTSAPNRLPTEYANTSPDTDARSIGNDNFISYNLYSFTYGDNDYNLLMKKYKNGAYKYPHIFENWSSWTQVDYYVFDKLELEQLEFIKDGVPTIIKLKVKVYNTLLEGNESSLNVIAKDIIAVATKENESSYKNYHNLYLIININKLTDKVQFLLKKNNFSISSYLTNKISEYNKPTIDMLQKGYYELSYKQFSNFIKLP